MDHPPHHQNIRQGLDQGFCRDLRLEGRYNVVNHIKINAEASLSAILPTDDNDKALENIGSSLGLIQIYWDGEDRKKNQEGDSGPITAQE